MITSALVEGSREGAHSSALPTVGCPMVTMGRPPIEAGVFGTASDPVTAMSSPATEREWYMTR